MQPSANGAVRRGGREARRPRGAPASRVARRGGRPVQGAHDPAHADGELDEAAGVRLALRLIGVEQRLVGLAREHRVQLPGQVGRVAQAGAHALAGEGRVWWAASPASSTRPARQRSATRPWKR
jgi:hypothetical protein